jgi:hypothetical protein
VIRVCSGQRFDERRDKAIVLVKWLVQEGLIKASPMQNIDPPEIPVEQPPILPDDMAEGASTSRAFRSISSIASGPPRPESDIAA